MKQTNNAIKFLMAQYRAIFKNANIAMVAAIAAAALASGQAQAAAGDLEKANWATLDGDVQVGTGAPTYSGAVSLAATADEDVVNDKKFKLKITDGANHAIKGHTGDVGKFTAKSGSLVIAGNGAVTATKLEVGNTNGVQVTFKDISVTKGTLALTKGTINAETITLGDTSRLTMAEGLVAADSIKLEKGATVEITKGDLGKADKTITVAKGAKIDTQAASTAIDNAKVLGNLEVSGTVNVDASKGMKIEGVADFLSGSTFVSKGATAFVKGGSIDDDATLTVEAGSDIRIGEATLTLSSANLKKLLSGTKVQSMTDKKAVVQLNDTTTRENPLDLAKTLILGEGDGAVSTKLAKQGSNGALTVKGDYAKYAGENKIDGQEGVTLSFKGLTVGKDNAVSFNKGGISVSESLAIKDNKALTLDSGNALTLDGASGSVAAKSVTIGSSKAAASLTVKNGTWTLPAVTVESGSATVESKATLKVNGALTATKEAQLVVNGGTVDVQGSGSLKLGGAAAKTVQLKQGGVLKIDAEDILSGKAFSKTNFAAGSVSGDGSTVIKIAGGDQLTDTEFKTFYAATGFKGVFDMNVKVDATGEITTDSVLPGLKTDAYNNKTLNVTESGKNNITSAFSVGNVNVKAEQDVKLYMALID